MRDARLAFRLFSRTPVETAIAIMSIALSVGAPAVVFTAIKSVLIDPLPYRRPAELIEIGTEIRHIPGLIAFWDDIQEVIKRNRTLESVGYYRNAVFDLRSDNNAPPEALYGVMMSASLFPTLGVSPMLGRNILPEEDQPGHPDVMILSYALWTRRFNSDRSVIRRAVRVGGHDCVVIGVMPPQFDFPLVRAAVHTPSAHVEFWAPLSNHPGARTGGNGAVARLFPGVTIEQARQDLASITPSLHYRDRTLRASPLGDRSIGRAKTTLLFLMAASVLFMLIGCANVANLLLARGQARQREIAIRLSIGASRARIVRQLLTESCVLAIIGGLAGYVLTLVAWKILPALAPRTIPRLDSAHPNWIIVVFALGTAVLNGILFGIAPAFRAAGQRHAVRDRIRSGLVIAEVTVCVMLVITGGQLLGSFVRLLGSDTGFDRDHLLASVVLASPERYRVPEQRRLFYKRTLDALRALPGVESAGTTDALPFSGENHPGFITSEVVGPMPAEIDVVSRDYLQTMGARLVTGRWFREEEMSPSSDTAIVSDFAAAHLWSRESAIGKRVCVYCTPENPNNWKRVIAVVTTMRHAALNEPLEGNVYLSAGALEKAVFVVVKTNRPTADLERAIRRAVAAIDPNQPVFLSASMGTLVANSVADRRFVMLLLAITGCLALLMSAAGVYGVISYTTSRRTREIGIRMAIGATPRKVHALVFRQGFIMVAVGLALGLVVAMAAMRGLSSVLVGLESADTGQVCAGVGLVTAAAGLACWIPARRATAIDLQSALRHE